MYIISTFRFHFTRKLYRIILILIQCRNVTMNIVTPYTFKSISCIEEHHLDPDDGGSKLLLNVVSMYQNTPQDSHLNDFIFCLMCIGNLSGHMLPASRGFSTTIIISSWVFLGRKGGLFNMLTCTEGESLAACKLQFFCMAQSNNGRWYGGIHSI
jgi:hypothetical protein